MDIVLCAWFVKCFWYGSYSLYLVLDVFLGLCFHYCDCSVFFVFVSWTCSFSFVLGLALWSCVSSAVRCPCVLCALVLVSYYCLWLSFLVVFNDLVRCSSFLVFMLCFVMCWFLCFDSCYLFLTLFLFFDFDFLFIVVLGVWIWFCYWNGFLVFICDIILINVILRCRLMLFLVLEFVLCIWCCSWFWLFLVYSCSCILFFGFVFELVISLCSWSWFSFKFLVVFLVVCSSFLLLAC